MTRTMSSNSTNALNGATAANCTSVGSESAVGTVGGTTAGMTDVGLSKVLSRVLPAALPLSARLAPRGVTIAIPNWNHEYVLPRSISSALKAVAALRAKQIPADVLVIDDQSRDGSLTLLRQLEALYYEDGLRALALPRNNDVVVVRNTALLKATYRYIVFMDADNELIPDNLPIFLQAMEDTKAALVYGNLMYRDQSNQPTKLINNESFQSRILRCNYIDTFALYDRNQIFDTGGFNEDFKLPSHEDWELMLHLAAAGRKLVFVPVMFGMYYELDKSRVRDANDSDLDRMAPHLERIFDQLGIKGDHSYRTCHQRYHPDIGYI